MHSSRGAANDGRPLRSQPPRPDDIGAAEATAMRILGGAGQSRAALRHRLNRHGFDEETSERVVAAFVERGYVEDVALAGSVAAKGTRRGHGKSRIAADLQRRGVDRSAIETVLDSMDESSEGERALGVARPLWTLREGEDPMHRRARVGAALQRRGYRFPVISRVLGLLGDEPREGGS